MSLPVHLVPSLSGLVAGATVVVEGDEAHHAVAVRRLRVGEQVVLTDGGGTRAPSEITSTDKRRFEARLLEVTEVPPDQPHVTVVQALPKGDRGELAVEVLTEVGADTIVPWASARSVAVWKGERGTKALARWRSTAREAAKQARRAWFPEVTDPATTQAVRELVAEADVAVVLHEAATVPLGSIDVARAGTILVVVGPEGGLTDDEVAVFAGAGAHVVRMGDEVLRTSTAGVAAVAALLSRTPRWR